MPITTFMYQLFALIRPQNCCSSFQISLAVMLWNKKLGHMFACFAEEMAQRWKYKLNCLLLQTSNIHIYTIQCTNKYCEMWTVSKWMSVYSREWFIHPRHLTACASRALASFSPTLFFAISLLVLCLDEQHTLASNLTSIWCIQFVAFHSFSLFLTLSKCFCAHTKWQNELVYGRSVFQLQS